MLILSTSSNFEVSERNTGPGIRHPRLPIQCVGTVKVLQVRLQCHLAPFFSAFFLTECRSLSFKVLQGKKENKKNIHNSECYLFSLKPTDQQKILTWMTFADC